tara:strand:+ start:21682 stop:22674 length:993 start_codon:yes stop_codon:yes gene_type:complete
MKLHIFLLTLLIIISCTQRKSLFQKSYSGQTQGTFFNIKYFCPENRDFSNAIDSIFKVIDFSVSLYNQKSNLIKLNQKKRISHDPIIDTLTKQSIRVNKMTSENFSCALFPVINYFGFYSKKRPASIDTFSIVSLISNSNMSNIKIDKDYIILDSSTSLDFNAIAQGYTCDLVAEYFNQEEIKNYMIEVGGEVRTSGTNYSKKKKWRIGVENPDETLTSNFNTVLELSDMSLATSGSYRNYYLDNNNLISHIIDPSTGFPSKTKVISSTVLHKKCSLADAIATSFMCMDIEEIKDFLKTYPQIQAIVIYEDELDNISTFRTSRINKITTN